MDFKYCPRIYAKRNHYTSAPLQQCGRLNPIKLSVNNKIEPPSTASITIDENNPDVSVGQLIRVLSPVADELMYVKSIKTDFFNGNQRVLNCEGVFGLLADAYAYKLGIGVTETGKITPSVINNYFGRPSSSTKCFAYDAFRYVSYSAINLSLSRINFLFDADYGGTDSFAYMDVKQGFSFNGSSVLNAVNSVSECLDDYQWYIEPDYDTSTVKLNMHKKQVGVTCELRESRNCKSISVNVDRKDFYSVLIPLGKKDKNIKSVDSRDVLIDGHTLTHGSNNVTIVDNDAAAAWGVVTVQQSDNTKTNAQDVYDWGVQRLRRHSDPAISVSVDALELSRLTDSPFDQLAPGKICRITLPNYNYTFTERIIECSFSDLVADEYSCKLTIANQRKDLKDILYQTGGGGGGKKKDNEVNCDLNQLDTDLSKIHNNTTARVLGHTAKWKSISIDGQPVYVMSYD